MEYLPTLCFAGFNSKMRKIPVGKKRKRAIVVVSVTTKFFVSQQTSKQMEEELDHDNNFLCRNIKV